MSNDSITLDDPSTDYRQMSEDGYAGKSLYDMPSVPKKLLAPAFFDAWQQRQLQKRDEAHETSQMFDYESSIDENSLYTSGSGTKNGSVMAAAEQRDDLPMPCIDVLDPMESPYYANELEVEDLHRPWFHPPSPEKLEAYSFATGNGLRHRLGGSVKSVGRGLRKVVNSSTVVLKVMAEPTVEKHVMLQESETPCTDFRLMVDHGNNIMIVCDDDDDDATATMTTTTSSSPARSKDTTPRRKNKALPVVKARFQKLAN